VGTLAACWSVESILLGLEIVEAIPSDWVEKLENRREIEHLASALADKISTDKITSPKN
jgi:hypothetical protein